MHNDKSHDHIFATFYVVQFSIRGCDISCVHGWGEGGYVHRSYFSNEYWAGIKQLSVAFLVHMHTQNHPNTHTQTLTHTLTHLQPYLFLTLRSLYKSPPSPRQQPQSHGLPHPLTPPIS